MRNEPCVTAIIATYNRAHLVSKAIESILGQTYQNIEVIVVDDGSTDDTQNVLKQFGDRVRVIRQDNAGPGAARNRGFAASRGDIIACLDSDDIWLPRKIDRQVAVLQRLSESVPCCLCSAELHFTDRPRLTSFQSALLRPEDEEGLWLNVPEVLTNRFVLFNQMAAIRRGALEKVGGFNEQLRFLEDYDLALRLSLLGPFAFIREPLVIWHQGSEGSLSEEAYRRMSHLRELEIRIREDHLVRLDADGNHEILKGQMRAALTKARRRLRIADLKQEESWGAVALGYILDKLEHYSDAANRRSPWFIEMKTMPLPEERRTLERR
jgi:glycosyltransferase involved in cell wall biosynthesis